MLQCVDRPACRRRARSHPVRQLDEAKRPVLVELDERDPLGGGHRRPVVGAACQAGEAAEKPSELVEDRRGVGSWGCHVTIIPQ